MHQIQPGRPAFEGVINGRTGKIVNGSDTATTKSLDELAREQGVLPLSDADELRGAPVENFELFIEALRETREGD